MRTAYVFLTLVLAVPSMILAAAEHGRGDLGVIGPVYSIREQDFLEYIRNRLDAMQRSGELQRMQKQELERARKSIQRPAPVSGITRTVKSHVFYINPALSVEHAIRDAEGRIIAMPGARVNPFNYLTMSKHLIFINGDDADQVKWATAMGGRYHGHVKTILVSGSPIDLMKRWKRRVFFDQHGVLTRRFHIRHVPAIVSQDKKRLRVAEVLP
ncbi:MAG: type-F conjugative transfer system protein TraW [Mariprofundaceae bacterium]|nr:type-F conjugative transfer system protein TraW [Mariprofundaceae bacterium]